jgi:flagellar protein FlbD
MGPGASCAPRRSPVIRVTRLDGTQFYVNAEFIQSVESTPDTHVVLLNGHSYVVRERDDEIVERIAEYRRGAGSTGRPPLQLLVNDDEAEG